MKSHRNPTAFQEQERGEAEIEENEDEAGGEGRRWN